MCYDHPINENKNTVDNVINKEFNIYDVGNNDGLDEYRITNTPNFNKDYTCIKGKMDKIFKKSYLMNYFLKHMVDFIVHN